MKFEIQLDGDAQTTPVHTGIRSPALGEEFVLHGLPSAPDGLRLRVVDIQQTDTDVTGWVCDACSVRAACVGTGRDLEDHSPAFLCRSSGITALVRPEDIPRLAMKGQLA